MIRDELDIAAIGRGLGVVAVVCRTAADLQDDNEREETMKFQPKKYPCADTRCTNQTDRPNTLCKRCQERERAEWNALHVQKNDPRRHK